MVRLATGNPWLFATVFLILPLVLLVAAVLYLESPLLLVIAVFTWMGIGLFLGAAAFGDPAEA